MAVKILILIFLSICILQSIVYADTIDTNVTFSNGTCYINNSADIDITGTVFVVNDSGIYNDDVELYTWFDDCTPFPVGELLHNLPTIIVIALASAIAFIVIPK